VFVRLFNITAVIHLKITGYLTGPLLVFSSGAFDGVTEPT